MFVAVCRRGVLALGARVMIRNFVCRILYKLRIRSYIRDSNKSKPEQLRWFKFTAVGRGAVPFFSVIIHSANIVFRFGLQNVHRVNCYGQTIGQYSAGCAYWQRGRRNRGGGPGNLPYVGAARFIRSVYACSLNLACSRRLDGCFCLENSIVNQNFFLLFIFTVRRNSIAFFFYFLMYVHVSSLKRSH